MTRKDYVALANALGEAAEKFTEGSEPYTTVLITASYVADVLAVDNGSFRRSQFMDAIHYRARTGKLVRVGQTRFDA